MTMRQYGVAGALLAALVAATFLSQVASAQAPGPAHSAPKPAQIDKNGVLILVRSTLLALDQANKTGNYTVLRDLGAPGFQAINTAARLGEIFAGQRKDNLDLSGVSVLEPQLSVLPEIDAQGMMRLAGFFPSVPTQIKFELVYAPVNRQWRLFGISVSLEQSTPTAPSEAVQHPAATTPAQHPSKAVPAKPSPPPHPPVAHPESKP